MAKTTIANKYHTKKNSTKQRGIDFDLTLEQFKVYWSLPNGVCDYTGVPFSGNGTSPRAPSLERIDKNKGYSVDNCCMVTVRANQLKDVIVDENGSTKLSLADLEMLKVVAEKIKTPEQLTSKYKQVMEKNEMANKVENPTFVSPSTQDAAAVTMHSDMDLIKGYTAFGHGKQVSFSKYKSLLARKTCEITKATFEDGSGMLSKVFITKDYSETFTDDNTIAVSKCVAGVLKSGLNESQVSRMLNFIK